MILTDDDYTQLVMRLGGPTLVSPQHQAMIKTDMGPRVEASVKKFVGYGIEQATYVEFYPIGDERTPESPLDNYRDPLTGSNFATLATVGISELYVKQLPVRSVAGVWENQAAWITDSVNGDWSSGFLLTPGTDYTVDWDEPGLSESGAIVRFGPWPRMKRSVKVAYTAGWTADELNSTDRLQPIKEAVMVTLQIKYLELTSLSRNPNTGGVGVISSESLADYRVSFDVSMWKNIFGLMTELPPQAKSLLREFVTIRKFMGR